MSSVSHFVRRYGFDGLIVVGALTAALEVALVNPVRAPETHLSFAVPAVAFVVLLLLGRRLFPFRRAGRALAGR